MNPFLKTVPSLPPYLVAAGSIEHTVDAVYFILDGANAEEYSDSQLYDLHRRTRKAFVWQPPVTLVVRGRFSHPQNLLRGTAGFGWWNAPFGNEN